MGFPRLNAVDSPEQWIVLARSAVAVSCPVDATEDILAVITVPANAMGPNGALRISAGWSVNNNANNKTLRCRLGGAAGTVVQAAIASTHLSYPWIGLVQNRNATNSQITSPHAAGGPWNTLAGTGFTPSAVDTTLPWQIVLSGQKAVGADTLTLENYLVELLQGA